METIPVQTLITIFVIASALILALAAAVALDRNHEAWKEGYEHALDVHRLIPVPRDEANLASAPRRYAQNRGPSWKEGYRSCLKAHGLPMTERDSEEMRSDPYTSMDNAARIADSVNSAAASVNNRNRFGRY